MWIMAGWSCPPDPRRRSRPPAPDHHSCSWGDRNGVFYPTRGTPVTTSRSCLKPFPVNAASLAPAGCRKVNTQDLPAHEARRGLCPIARAGRACHHRTEAWCSEAPQGQRHREAGRRGADKSCTRSPQCAHRMCSCEDSGPSVVPPVRTGFWHRGHHWGPSSTDGPPVGQRHALPIRLWQPGDRDGRWKNESAEQTGGEPTVCLVCAFLRSRGTRSRLARGELEHCFRAPRASPSPGAR